MFPKKMLLYLFTIWVVIPLTVVACAGNNPPRVAATVATHGTAVMEGIRAAQNVVIQAEAQGTLPRNAAVSSMEVFKRLGAAGETLAGYLQAYAALSPGSSEAQSQLARIREALRMIDSQLFEALVPIGDEATRKQVSALAVQISQLLLTIDTELVGGR